MPTLVYETHLSIIPPNNTFKTVIITGGNGFVGTYIVNQLLDLKVT
jgi:FlaA1/EpsC-like NDP-sugar epimerase